ncbi:DivIVA domain-containing protein [Candidatus Latescibacterota bacterium]
MNISPLDIRKHEFKKVIRGFDVDEVTAFLDMISVEYENMIRENALMNEKVANLDTQLKKYRDIESTLRETLLSAQKAREDTISSAKRQSEVIIREAEVKAAAIIEDGRNTLSRLKNSFHELKIQKDSYLTKIKALTKAQLDMLEQYAFPEEEKADSIKSVFQVEPEEQHEPQKEPEREPAKVPDHDKPLSRETFFPDDDE